jgi:hypothetical protein
MPLKGWLAGPYAAMFRDEVLRPNAAIGGAVDLSELAARFEHHRAGRDDHSYALWAAWVLERWLTAARAEAVKQERLAVG